jgi:hypothetical protein
VFEKKVFKRIFGRNIDEVTGGWSKLRNGELHNLYSSPYTSQLNPVNTFTFTFFYINLILSLHLRKGVPTGFFPPGFRLKFCSYFLSLVFVISPPSMLFCSNYKSTVAKQTAWMTHLIHVFAFVFRCIYRQMSAIKFVDLKDLCLRTMNPSI